MLRIVQKSIHLGILSKEKLGGSLNKRTLKFTCAFSLWLKLSQQANWVCLTVSHQTSSFVKQKSPSSPSLYAGLPMTNNSSSNDK